MELASKPHIPFLWGIFFRLDYSSSCCASLYQILSIFQEKMKGKNRLVPRLLGVTKDSVLRLDEKTKEILKTWPLTTVRRWAAAPNVFTLDFGDYQDQYYSVQTTEGEQIAQLISGYIDIIMKRRQKKERFGDDGNEEEVMEEDIVTPSRAITMVGLPGTNRKPEMANLAKPGVLRNSGGMKGCVIIFLLSSEIFFILFFFVISFVVLFSFLFIAQLYFFP